MSLVRCLRTKFFMHWSNPRTRFVARLSTSTDSQKYSDVRKSSKQEEEEDTKGKLLDLALEFVPEYGWSKQALSRAAKSLGFPSVAHGLVSRGAIDIIFYFERKSNNQIVEEFYPKSPRTKTDEEKPNVTAFLYDIIKARLALIEPYIEKWPQALALQSQPQYTVEAFTNLGHLMDDIWYLAGDNSTDMNWYTKRISLGAIYGSAELYMLQDRSPGYENTWTFVENRLDDFVALLRARKRIESQCKSSLQLLETTISTISGMIGRRY
ncbi:ubiquinone biosynthesis protein COQ9, mitochondrial-like [Oscarella lobularis]|uniref:ubiquinone biosynthesis protein COQ9, mitochondrial-like n=1 Tax=Oscarella lobularis TaxID=121494 RepID=UPI00331353C7